MVPLAGSLAFAAAIEQIPAEPKHAGDEQ